MPDFERLTDQMRVELSLDPKDRAYWSGYKAGKTQARCEVVAVLVVAVIVFFLISI